MINYIKGNLLITPDKFIMHGVNCQGVMGSGVAKAIKEHRIFKNAYYDYLRYCQSVHINQRLGTINISTCNDADYNYKFVLNAFTQFNYGTPSICHVDYNAVDVIMRDTRVLLRQFNELSISMPKIGAGLGGGDWNIIEKIIDSRLADINVNVWVLE